MILLGDCRNNKPNLNRCSSGYSIMLPGTISLIFFFIEFIMLLIILARNRDHPQIVGIVIIMTLLQIYQLSEFLLCIGVNENIVGRIAFITITFLPPTGYHLSAKLMDWKHKEFLIWYLLAVIYSIYCAIIPESVVLVDCNPLYAVYTYPSSRLYGYYYFLVIFCAIGLNVYLLKKDPISKSETHAKAKSKGVYIIWGYLGFLIPMGLTLYIQFQIPYGSSLPSLMCKYAITVALWLFSFSFKKGDTEKMKIKIKISKPTNPQVK
jgi:hypothetical protein